MVLDWRCVMQGLPGKIPEKLILTRLPDFPVINRRKIVLRTNLVIFAAGGGVALVTSRPPFSQFAL